jgi:hypothetical protein
MWPLGVTMTTNGSQSQYVAQAPAVDGEHTITPTAIKAASTTLFTRSQPSLRPPRPVHNPGGSTTLARNFSVAS